MRYCKTDGDYITNYYYDSQNNLIGLDKAGSTLFFYYDSNGTPTAFKNNDIMYYYIKNLQGDIVKIVNQDGTVVASYTYDAFEKILTVKDTAGNDVPLTLDFHVANLNPFRYRGYIYDDETGLYYLKSRYYDPETGRFINADIYCDTMSNILGTNMFTYCNNNPVNQVDPEGTDAYWLQFGNAVGGFGHTSLLLEDSVNNWWYFYWGEKQVILRPCGRDDFSMYELNSYLTGFDPRPHHNYYVYATNVIDDSNDIGYVNNNDKYNVKCHDKCITDWLYLSGDFTKSFKYAKNLLERLYSHSNANQLIETIYENGKRLTMYRVCEKIYYSNNSGLYYLRNLKTTNSEIVRSYNVLSYNCVQVSMEVLLEGTYYGSHQIYKNRLMEVYGHFLERDMLPNTVYNYFRII